MNCKPGDLAIVVRSATPENVGKMVHVIRPFTQGECGICALDKGALWLCVAAGSKLALRDAFGLCTEQFKECPIPDHCLRPIRPGDDVHDNSELVDDGLVVA